MLLHRVAMLVADRETILIRLAQANDEKRLLEEANYELKAKVEGIDLAEKLRLTIQGLEGVNKELRESTLELNSQTQSLVREKSDLLEQVNSSFSSKSFD